MEKQRLNIQRRLHQIRRTILILTILTAIVLTLGLLLIPIDEKVQARGRVHAKEETYVRAAVEGTLKELPVREGDRVAKGAVLAVLDATEKEGELRALEAQIDQADAELTLRVKRWQRAMKLPLPVEFRHIEEDYEIARKKKEQSEIDLARAASLASGGAVSKHYIETAELTVAVSTAEFQKMEKKREIVDRGLEKTIIEEAKAEVAMAKENLRILGVQRETLRAEIERHTLRSPEEGVVTLIVKRMVGERAAKGEDLFHVAHGTETRVVLRASESQFHRIKAGQSVIMTTPAFHWFRYGHIRGSVARTAFEADRSGDKDAPPSYRVSVKVENSPQPLVLGTSVDAKIILRRNSLWRVFLAIDD